MPVLRTRNLLSSCRFSSAEMDDFFQEYQKHQSQHHRFKSRMETLMDPPRGPSDAELGRLQEHWPEPRRSETHKPPPWLKLVAVQRDMFMCAVLTQSAELNSKAWFILYVKKSPVQAVVLEMQVALPQQLPESCCSHGDQWPPKYSTWTFACASPQFHLLSEALFEDGPILVIGNCFWAGSCLVSIEEPLNLRPGCMSLESRVVRTQMSLGRSSLA